MIFDRSDIKKFIDYRKELERERMLELEKTRLESDFNNFLLDSRDNLKNVIKKCMPSSQVVRISDEGFKENLIKWLNGNYNYELSKDTYETIISKILVDNGIVIDTIIRGGGMFDSIVSIYVYIDINYLISKLDS